MKSMNNSTPINVPDGMLLQFQAMFDQFRVQFQSQSNCNELQTPTSTSSELESFSNEECTEPDLCRTSSESSSSITASNSKKRKIPSAHRHFKYQPLKWTLKEFTERLKGKLSVDESELKLLELFPSLHDFRKKFIIPLTVKYPGDKEIELMGCDKDFCSEFVASYKSLFVEGCHISRVQRIAGFTPKDNEERTMYCVLIRALWEIVDFDVDGFGNYFSEKHAQVVEGHTPFSIQNEFAKHLQTFVLSGLTSISHCGIVLNIMNAADTLNWLNGRLEEIKSEIKRRLNKLSFETGITDTETLFATLQFRTTQTTKRLRFVENIKLVNEQNDSTDDKKRKSGGPVCKVITGPKKKDQQKFSIRI